jgi:hypothetical protein
MKQMSVQARALHRAAVSVVGDMTANVTRL